VDSAETLQSLHNQNNTALEQKPENDQENT